MDIQTPIKLNICDLNADVTSVILDFLHCEDAVNLRLTSKYMKECVTNQKWDFYDNKLPSNWILFPNAIGLNLDNRNIDLSTIPTDSNGKIKLKKLKNFAMSLYNQDDLRYLKGITVLDVSKCYENIGKNTFINFSKIHTLNIPNVVSISDNAFIHLKNIHTLNISNCKQIKDNAFIHLKNIHTLNMSNCDQITDNAFIHLKNIHTLNITNCNQITDDAFIHLNNIHTLNMTNCDQITDNAFIHLNNIHTLNISYCNNIKYNRFKYIKNIHTLTMTYSSKITNIMFDDLENINTMNMYVNIYLMRDFSNLKLKSNIVNGEHVIKLGDFNKNIKLIPNFNLIIV